MLRLIRRGLLAVTFVGLIGLAGWAGTARGQGAGGYLVYAPVVARQLPFMKEPPLAGYVAVMDARRDLDDYEIFTVRGDGSDVQQLTDNSTNDNTPSFSPDGSQIAFWRESSPRMWAIMVMNRDGSGERTVKETYSVEPNILRWSPDGLYLLTVVNDHASSGGHFPLVLLQGVDDGTSVYMGRDANGQVMDWSPDGRYFYYVTDVQDYRRLWVYSMASRTATSLGEVGPFGGWDELVVWHDRHEELVFRNNFGRVIAVMPNGTEPRVLAEGYSVHGWLENTGQLLLSNGYDLYTVPFSGGEVRFLANGGSSVLVGGVSPSGDAVVYQSDVSQGPVRYKRLGSASVVVGSCEATYEYCLIGPDATWATDGSAFVYEIINHNGPAVLIQTIYVPPGENGGAPVITDGKSPLGFLPGSSRYGWGLVYNANPRVFYVLDLPAGTATALAPELGSHRWIGGWRYVGSEGQ